METVNGENMDNEEQRIRDIFPRHDMVKLWSPNTHNVNPKFKFAIQAAWLSGDIEETQRLTRMLVAKGPIPNAPIPDNVISINRGK